MPVTPSPAAASVAPAAPAKAASDDYMDQASFKELFQMVGAMLFVALLSAAGWHAAHYSGAWPY
ncbi:hypothetical protein GOB81_11995 [Acetobacter sp. LMG 1627]|uniref:Uncharacterized protein n=1 Tax=Acetobacter conturbans TaxID=1737472 RepID=A0ABX0K4T2_9PROT|nr:hypothetical protein [Acetobacter conturbans]